MEDAGKPLYSLSRGVSTNVYVNKDNGCGSTNFAWIILWFFIIAVIVWILLYVFKPTWVQTTSNGQPTGTVDVGKALLWAVIIGLVLSLVIWVVWAWGMSC